MYMWVRTDVCHACGFRFSDSDPLCGGKGLVISSVVALCEPAMCQEGILKQFGICLTRMNILPAHLVPGGRLRRLWRGAV